MLRCRASDFRFFDAKGRVLRKLFERTPCYEFKPFISPDFPGFTHRPIEAHDLLLPEGELSV